MLTVNYSTIKNSFKKYCDKVSDSQETIIITRKNEKNVVLISLAQLEIGKGKEHELIEID